MAARSTPKVTESAKDDDLMTETDPIVTLGDDAVVTFKWLGDAIGIPSNTIVRRIFPEKVLPVYQALDCPPLRTETNRLTGFGAKATASYIRQCIQGGRSWESWRNEVRSSYTADTTNDLPVIEAELVDDDEPIAPPGAMTTLREIQQDQADELDAEISALIFKKQRVEDKRSALANLQKKQQEKELLKAAVRRKMAVLEQEEAAIDAEMEAELIVSQALGEVG